MSKRLQVLLDETELAEIQGAARRGHLTVAQWVRQALREARRRSPTVNLAERLEAVARAALHSFPTGPIDQILSEIERGYDQEREP